MLDEKDNENNTSSEESTVEHVKPSKKLRVLRALVVIAIAACVILATFLTLKLNSEACKVPKENRVVAAINNAMTLGINEDGSLRFDANQITIKTRTGTCSFPVDFTKYRIDSFEVFNTSYLTTYESLEGHNVYCEYVGEAVEGVGSFDTEVITSTFDNNKYTSVNKVSGTTGYTMGETLSSVYKEAIAYAYDVNVEVPFEEGNEIEHIDQTICDNTVNNLKYSKEVDYGYKLGIDGIGEFDASQLSTTKEHCGVAYSSDNGMVMIYNDTIGAQLFITTMYNNNLGNDPGKLMKMEEYKNVYVDYGWQNKADFGYGGFAVATESGMYYFKISENVENPEEFRAEILGLLGISTSDDYIEHGYIIYMTMEDMRPTLEDEEANKTVEEDTVVENEASENVTE